MRCLGSGIWGIGVLVCQRFAYYEQTAPSKLFDSRHVVGFKSLVGFKPLTGHAACREAAPPPQKRSIYIQIQYTYTTLSHPSLALPC